MAVRSHHPVCAGNQPANSITKIVLYHRCHPLAIFYTQGIIMSPRSVLGIDEKRTLIDIGRSRAWSGSKGECTPHKR
jgi:hypothetical protein